MRLLIALALLAIVGTRPGLGAENGAKRNVLFICIDDLRPVLGCYGGGAKTPHLDRFASSGVRFNRHYVQFPSCGPSRSCMFGGVRPDTISLFGNGGANVVANNPKTRPTMPLHFRNQGFTTLSFGKTYHSKGIGEGFGWSQKPWHPPSGWTCYVDFEDKGKPNWRPAFEIYEGADVRHGDYQTADQAIRALEDNREGPFFIAAGFYKPHLPFVAPKAYWDLYEDDEIELLEPRGIPKGALTHQYGFRELCAYGYKDGDKEVFFTPENMPTPAQARDLTHAYYAAVSFIDAQVGRILKRLDELGLSESTAVVIWGDHGFHLGDQERWAKWTQFEADMRSPLIMRLPGKMARPRATDALVESVDIYPTLADYCGIGLPKHLEGVSLLPLIAGKVSEVKKAALSQVKPLKTNQHLLAYSLRTADYRYVEWRDTKQDYKLVDRELYDLRAGGGETENLAGNPEYAEVLKACRKLSIQGYPSLRFLSEEEPVFLKGADISLLDAIEERGGVYKEEGEAKDALSIFRDHGCNAMRVRLFHTPTGDPPLVNDLAYTQKLGRRIKDAGMALLLDIHYSDSWADPGKQTKPKAWKNLSFEELEKAVFEYTKDVIVEMKKAGAMPDIVQIGNEIAPGMLWDSGRVGGKGFNNSKQWRNLALLLKAGIEGVYAGADGENVRTMIHIHCGGNAAQTRKFFDPLIAEGLEFDLIGLSYYPWWHSEGRGLDPLRENLKATIERFGKDVIVVETGYPWRPNSKDPETIMHKGQARPLVPGLPASPENQRVFLERIQEVVRNAPEGRGMGVFYWAPEYIPAPRLRPGREHLSLFDPEGNVLPGMKAFE